MFTQVKYYWVQIPVPTKNIWKKKKKKTHFSLHFASSNEFSAHHSFAPPHSSTLCCYGSASISLTTGIDIQFLYLMRLSSACSLSQFAFCLGVLAGTCPLPFFHHCVIIICFLKLLSPLLIPCYGKSNSSVLWLNQIFNVCPLDV